MADRQFVKLPLLLLPALALTAAATDTPPSPGGSFDRLAAISPPEASHEQALVLLREMIREALDCEESLAYDPLAWRRASAAALLIGIENPHKVLMALAETSGENEEDAQVRYLFLNSLAYSAAKNPGLYPTVVEALDEELAQFFLMNCLMQFTAGEETGFPEPLLAELEKKSDLLIYAVRMIAFQRPDQLENIISRLSPEARQSALPGAFEQLAAHDPSNALALFENYREEILAAYTAHDALPQLVGSLVSISPKEARTVIDQTDDPSRNASLLSAYLSSLGRTEPESALQTLSETTLSADEKDNVRRGILQNWKENNPRRFADYALTLDPAQVQEDQWLFFRNWPDGQEATAANFAREFVRIHENRYRNRVDGNPLIEVLEDWARDDPEAARQWIRTEPDANFRDIALASLVRTSSQNDYETTVALYDEITSPQVRAQLAIDVAAELAEHDVQSGIEWIRRIGQEMAPRKAAQKFFIQWASNDIEGLMENFPRDIDPVLQGDAVYWIGRNYHQADPEKVTQWLRTLPEDISYRSTYFYPNQMATNAPDTGIAFLQDHPRLRKSWYAHSQFFAKLSDVNRDKAIELLDNVNRNGRIAGLDAITKQILKESPEEFSHFYEQFPEKKDRDIIRIAYVNQWGKRDPAQAMGMILDVEPSHRNRKNAVSRAILFLNEDDPQAAFSIITTDPRLSEEEWKFALEYLNEGKKLPHER